MSTTIDQRVVEMRFDNRQFERNVSTTMSTLEKLKQKLNFNGSVKGMDNVSNAAKTASSGMSNFGSSVEAVSLKFSAMQVFAMTALTRMSNAAITAGKRITSALTIDPVKTGFSEYETKINAVQTIMSNTASKGKTMEDVTKVLDELNTYADKTIYNFAEMTRNIGTFTAAGVGLEESAAAIQGIANLAAASGSTSQQASTAMYQLSQALAAGTVKLMDWNSVVNAGMGGEKFQEALKATAREHGVSVDAMIKDAGSFRESLQKGWITADILNETLNKFTTKGAKEYGDAMVKSGKWTREQADALLEEAKNMEDAATKVKTFTQLWDTLKESAQSGWAKTWELIFGDFYEARDLFSGLSDFFGGIINGINDFRNSILESALGKSFTTIAEKINGVIQPAAKAIEVVEDLGDIVNKVIRGDFGNGAERVEKLTEAGYNYYRVQNKVNETLNCSKRFTDEQIEAQDKLLGKQGKSTEKTDEQTKATVKLNDEQKNQLKTLAMMTEEELKAKGYTEEQIAALKELGEQAKKLGIPVDEFIDKMDEITGRWLLLNAFKNIGKGIVDVFNAMKTAWQEVFPPKSIEERAEQLFKLIGGFHKLTSYLVGVIYDGENLTATGDKLVRTFKGVFAVIDIITTLVGGGFKIAFKAVTALLGKFDLNILDVTAAIGDALVKFRDWIDKTLGVTKAMDILVPLVKGAAKFIGNLVKTVKNSQWFKAFVDYVEKASDGLSKLFASIPDMSSFKNLVSVLKNAGSAIKKWFSAIKSADDIPGHIISGLVNGIRNGVPKVISAVWALAKEIISSICEVLGIHSPSTVMMAIGGFIIAGLIKGMASGEIDLLGTAETLSVKLVDAVKAVFANLVEWVKSVDLGTLLAIGMTGGILLIFKSVADSLEIFAAPLEGFKDVCDKIGDTFDALKSSIKASTWQKRAKAVMSFAIAIAILAASVYVLSKIDFWSLSKAVLAIGALAGIIVALSWAIGKLGPTEGIEVGKFAVTLLGLSASMLIIATALKQLAYLDLGELAKGVGAILAISIIMSGLMVATNFVGLDAIKIGSTLIKMAATMAIMVWVVKLASSIDAEAAKKGTIAILAFSGVMAGMLAMTKLVNKDSFGSASVDKLGGTLLKMSIAMILMIAVLKLASKLDADDAVKGGAAILAFSGIFTGLIAMTKLYNADATKVGTTLLAMSTAMLIMVGVVALAAKIAPGDMFKGVLTVAAFGGIVTGLVAATKLVGGNELKRVGTTLLMMSVCIGIMGIIAALMGMMDLGHLAKGVGAVTIMGGIIAVMVWATRGASDCKANIIAMTVAITAIAVAIAALSLIDTEKLLSAAGSLGVVMGMFALMMKASSAATGSIKHIIVMTVAIGLIAGALFLLSSLPIESSISSAASMSVLLLSLAASITIVSKAGAVAPKALIAIGVMTAVVGAIAGILYLMKDMDAKTTLSNALAISELLATLSLVCGIASLIPAPAAISGALGLAAFIGIMAAVVAAAGALSLIPGFNTLIANGGETLGLVGYAIGNFVGSILGGLSAGATSGLPAIGKNLSDFMEEAGGFVTGMTELGKTNLVDNIESFADAISALSKAAGRNGQSDLSKWMFGDNSLGTFGEELASFGESISEFATNLTKNGTFDEATVATINCACDAIRALSAASTNINGQADWSKSVFGDNSLATFGAQLPALGANLSGFAASLGTFDKSKTATIDSACSAIKALADTASTIPAEGGGAQKLFGEQSLAAFSGELPILAINLNAFAANLGAFDDSKVSAVQCVCKAIKTLTEAAGTIDGQAEWSKVLFGDNGLAAFSGDLPGLGTNMSAFATNLGTFDASMVATVACAGEAIKSLATAASSIDGQADWAKKIFGDNGLAAFGTQLGSVGTNLAAFVKNLGTFTEAQVSTVTAAVKAIAALATLANADLKNAKKNFEGFGDKLGTLATDISTFCEDMPASDGVDSALTSIRNIIAAINEIEAANTGALGALADNLRNLGSEAVDKFVGAFTSIKAKTNVKDAADDLADEAVEGLDGLDDDAEDAGEDLGTGLVRGIRSKYDAAYDAGYRLGQKAVQGEKDGQKSNSPSKLTIQSGKWFGEGLVIGIQKMGESVYAAGYGLGNTAVKALGSTVSRIAAAIDSDMDIQPTIRPVVDLTEVRTGARAINGMLNVGSSVGALATVGAISNGMRQRGQNGNNDEVIRAIDRLGKGLENVGNTTNIIEGVTYDDGSNVANAVKEITRYARMGRRR